MLVVSRFQLEKLSVLIRAQAIIFRAFAPMPGNDPRRNAYAQFQAPRQSVETVERIKILSDRDAFDERVNARRAKHQHRLQRLVE